MEPLKRGRVSGGGERLEVEVAPACVMTRRRGERAENVVMSTFNVKFEMNDLT